MEGAGVEGRAEAWKKEPWAPIQTWMDLKANQWEQEIDPGGILWIKLVLDGGGLALPEEGGHSWNRLDIRYKEGAWGRGERAEEQEGPPYWLSTTLSLEILVKYGWGGAWNIYFKKFPWVIRWESPVENTGLVVQPLADK